MSDTFRKFVTHLLIPLTPEHYTALGRVAALWSVQEAYIQHLIWALMGVSKNEGALFTSSLRLETHLTILPILAATKKIDAIQQARLEYVIGETKRLQERRNTVIHTQWSFVGGKPGVAKTFKVRLKDTGHSEEFTPEAIARIAEQITDLVLATANLHLSWRQTSP